MADLLPPPDGGKWVKTLRFLNVLDDDHNRLSPTKINVWAASAATFSAGTLTILHWVSGHIGMIGELWGPIGGWLTQSHLQNQFNKRDRNKHVENMKELP